MARDELDDRLLRAARADQALVDRVVRTALASGEVRAGGVDQGAANLSARAWPPAFALATACLAGAVGLGIWWCAREPVSPGLDGSPGRIISVRMDDGTTWILSTAPDDDWLPQGGGIVVGGAEGR